MPCRPHLLSPVTVATAARLSAVVVLVVLASCGTSGRELRPVSEDATGPERSTSSIAAPVDTFAPAEGEEQFPGDDTTETTTGAETAEGTASALVLDSPTWQAGDAIPSSYTCEGENISPPLRITGVPDDATSLALVATDPDAGGFVHWLVTGIDPAIEAIDADTIPDGATVANNSAGTDGWSGPCPPPGERHTYHLTLLVLGEEVAVPGPDEDPMAAVVTLEGQSTSRSLLTGTFER